MALVFKRYNSYMKFQDDLNSLKLHSWHVSDGVVFAIFSVEDEPPAFENVISIRRYPADKVSGPSLSREMQSELEPLPGHGYKWDGGDIGEVRRYGTE